MLGEGTGIMHLCLDFMEFKGMGWGGEDLRCPIRCTCGNARELRRSRLHENPRIKMMT